MDTSQKSLKGQLILDNGKLRGSFFHRTVILICQHDSEGAFGLVLNRSTKNKVGEAVVANLPDTLKEETCSSAGRADPGLSYLHNDYLPARRQRAHEPQPRPLARFVGRPRRVVFIHSAPKIFAGYAGWSPVNSKTK
jgi:putative transcriptional regulator